MDASGPDHSRERIAEVDQDVTSRESRGVARFILGRERAVLRHFGGSLRVRGSR
jgi:hypothetical protein